MYQTRFCIATDQIVSLFNNQSRNIWGNELLNTESVPSNISYKYRDTEIAQHTPYQGFSVTGYIRTGTGVKQTEVDCELTNGALSSRY